MKRRWGQKEWTGIWTCQVEWAKRWLSCGAQLFALPKALEEDHLGAYVASTETVEYFLNVWDVPFARFDALDQRSVVYTETLGTVRFGCNEDWEVLGTLGRLDDTEKRHFENLVLDCGLVSREHSTWDVINKVLISLFKYMLDKNAGSSSATNRPETNTSARKSNINALRGHRSKLLKLSRLGCSKKQSFISSDWGTEKSSKEIPSDDHQKITIGFLVTLPGTLFVVGFV